MLQVICDKCKKEFKIKRIKVLRKYDFAVQYFECPYCNKKYHVLTTDSELRKNIKNDKENNIALTNEHKKEFDKLRPIGEKILKNFD